MLHAVAPEVAKEAFVDGRTLYAHNCDPLKQTVGTIIEMDEIMGHTTNFVKSQVWAKVQRIRKQMGSTTIRGVRLSLVSDNKILGHRCIGAMRYVTNGQEG